MQQLQLKSLNFISLELHSICRTKKERNRFVLRLDLISMRTPFSAMKKRPREESDTHRPQRSRLLVDFDDEDDDIDMPQRSRLLVHTDDDSAGENKVSVLTPPIKGDKRPREGYGVICVKDDICGKTNIFKFRVLLPNGTSVELKMSDQRKAVPIEKFIDMVKKEYDLLMNQKISLGLKRRIIWEYQDLYFTDARNNKIRLKVDFGEFVPGECNLLWLHDGSTEADEYEDMWDLTPDTDLLKELPDDYTSETALADLIDNSLQALWSNDPGERRLISVKVHQDKISIFDSGPGMDGASGNIVKWGKMGASVHRSVRERAIGGKPPYLMPFFGMFGYGGPVATMCLGRRAVVSSKTKRSNKVFTLHMEREALVSASHTENCWKTKGGVRDPSEDEMRISPHGSFTKVEIFDPKPKVNNQYIRRLRFELKDIYFPYIQCDEVSGKTSRPVEFKVNGVDLAEIQGGEVATTNMHSCNGPEFVVQLHFSSNTGSSSMATQNQRVSMKANARLKCVYFPTIEGKESINIILDNLNKDGLKTKESFESFSRVSVRRLGRLLPDIRWPLLPFMEPKLSRGEKGQSLKRIFSRVKCFIDTDAGFNPTPHKTDLAHHHPYTKALKNFGNRSSEDEEEVQVEITRNGEKLALSQLQKLYQDWVSEMHGHYDVEIDDGLDNAIIVVVTSKIKKLDLSSSVLRVHKKIQRKGICWEAGQHMKVLKGACAGCHKNNVYATLEYIIFEGLQGDSGEARLICRPIGVPEKRGCFLSVGEGNTTININDSYVFPIRIIDGEKCTLVDGVEWGKKIDSINQKLPAAIDLLSVADCQELEIDGGLPCSVEVGDAPPENVVAAIRPKSFSSANCSKKLDQKFIVRDNHQMVLSVSFKASKRDAEAFEHVYSATIQASSHKGLHGLYLFPLRSPMLFQKPGVYTFSFSLVGLKDIQFKHDVLVEPSGAVIWKIVNRDEDDLYTVRVGSCFQPLIIASIDRYKNHIPFTRVPNLKIKLSSSGKTLAQVRSKNVEIARDKLSMKIKDFFINSSELDDIRPSYKAMLQISTPDEAFSVDFPCRVLPGTPKNIVVHPTKVQKQLLPGQILEELKLEVLDEYGNHVKEDECISLRLNGLSFQDGSGTKRDMGIDCQMKVDANGQIDLSNALKVSTGYGKRVLLSVLSKHSVMYDLHFYTERRELRAVQKVFKNCKAGSVLKNVAFEITDSQGEVDETIHDEEKHGQSHILKIMSKSLCIDDSVKYRFHHGRCTIPSIPLPDKGGPVFFSASHSRYPELKSTIEVHVEKTRKESRDSAKNHVDVGNPIPIARSLNENEQIPRNGSSDISSKLVASPSQVTGKAAGSVLSPQKVQLEKKQQENAVNFTNHEDVGNPTLSSEVDLVILDSPSSREIQVRDESFSTCSSNGFLSPISYAPTLTPKLEHTDARGVISDLGKSSSSLGSLSRKEVEDGVANSWLKKSFHKKNIERLALSQSLLEHDVSRLQALIGPDLGDATSLYSQHSTQEKIKSRSQSAAASVICTMSEEERKRLDIVGVVALLGTVETVELSRMLAQYLGEDQMLAIVCRNESAACSLETDKLHKFATEHGLGYHTFCLDISPSTGEPSIDPQQLLPLKHPTLPNGDAPRGFLGYAVNLISVEPGYLQWRTKRGDGLRETLFFSLFDKLQVYRDRSCMMAARSCIKAGAVSLDGGIIKANGLISQGHWKPEILFPVMRKAASAESLRLKLELEKINRSMTNELEAYRRSEEEFDSFMNEYKSYMSQQEAE